MERTLTDLAPDPSPVSAAGCPVQHTAPPAAAQCPVPHAAPAATCPFPHSAAPSVSVRRSPADMFVRKLLRIRERPAGVTAASAYTAFRRSMLISATRCTLTYVIFPFVLPAVGFATGAGPIIGVIIGTLAITCDVLTIRRFFAIDHKWRWHYSAIALSIIGLLLVLLVQDIIHLLR